MFRFGDQLADHGLDHADVAVQGSAEKPSYQCYPNVGGKPENHHAEHCSGTANEQDWFPSNAVRKSSPVHAHHGLRECEGRDEQARVGSCILFVANFEPLDELPGIGEDRGESNGLGEANNSWSVVSRVLRSSVLLGEVDVHTEEE